MTPEQLERELKTLEGFEKWLESRSGVVGFARRDCGCPLYHYLLEQLGEQIQIACDGIAIGDGRVKHSPLSYRFTRQIDDGRSNGQAVTSRQARQALKLAKKEASA